MTKRFKRKKERKKEKERKKRDRKDDERGRREVIEQNKNKKPTGLLLTSLLVLLC